MSGKWWNADPKTGDAVTFSCTGEGLFAGVAFLVGWRYQDPVRIAGVSNNGVPLGVADAAPGATPTPTATPAQCAAGSGTASPAAGTAPSPAPGAAPTGSPGPASPSPASPAPTGTSTPGSGACLASAPPEVDLVAGVSGWGRDARTYLGAAGAQRGTEQCRSYLVTGFGERDADGGPLAARQRGHASVVRGG